MPTKRSGSPAEPTVTYVEWKVHAAALLEWQGISAGFMREKERRKLFIQGSPPEDVVRHAEVLYHNIRPPLSLRAMAISGAGSAEAVQGDRVLRPYPPRASHDRERHRAACRDLVDDPQFIPPARGRNAPWCRGTPAGPMAAWDGAPYRRAGVGGRGTSGRKP
jgi:hypothetical protein